MRYLFLRQALSDAAIGAGRCIEHTLMPACCVFCGTATAADVPPICAGCHDDLPWNRPACPRCAGPLPAGVSATTSCGDCLRRPPAWDAAVAPLRFRFPVDAAVKAFKFRRRLSCLPLFEALLIEALPAIAADVDLVQPVPLHRFRRMRRGFNQARELAIPVADALGAPLSIAVERHRRTRTQSELTAAERRGNVRDAFRLRAPIDARHVLLVDDVMTTGATLTSVTRLLKRHGVQRVSVLVLARAVGRH